jgi:hypothetical protein
MLLLLSERVRSVKLCSYFSLFRVSTYFCVIPFPQYISIFLYVFPVECTWRLRRLSPCHLVRPLTFFTALILSFCACLPYFLAIPCVSFFLHNFQATVAVTTETGPGPIHGMCCKMSLNFRNSFSVSQKKCRKFTETYHGCLIPASCSQFVMIRCFIRNFRSWKASGNVIEFCLALRNDFVWTNNVVVSGSLGIILRSWTHLWLVSGKKLFI